MSSAPSCATGSGSPPRVPTVGHTSRTIVIRSVPTNPTRRSTATIPSRGTLRRRLRRDATGESGYKVTKSLLRALGNPIARRSVLEVLGVQAVLFVVLAVSVGWWAWPLLWFAPWVTAWRVINRLRAIAEHGGMVNSDDDRLTTHHVRQSRSARFWMVPYNTGWHIAHHADMGVPWRNLPRLHRELVAAGHILPALEYPSYVALWRKLASRPLSETAQKDL